MMGDLLNALSQMKAPGGYGVRQPYQGEMDYFKANPTVTGMAAEDNRVILNPFSNLDPKQKQSVLLNEAARLWMRQNNIVPEFNLTEQQKKAFANTPYGDDELALKQSIVARILSGDPSALDVTPEQRSLAERIANEMGINLP